MKITTRCTSCQAEFTEEQLLANPKFGCPACGTTSLPCDPAHDIMLPINWSELRILTMWASNWADRFPPGNDDHKVTLQKILQRIDKHRPPGGAGLTLVQEVKELQDKYPGASLHTSDGTMIVPPRDEPNGGSD